MTVRFQSMPFKAWRSTHDTLHTAAQLAGAVRQKLTPYQKHWFHISLRVSARGPVTPPVAYEGGSLELALDLTQHELFVQTSRGDRTVWSFAGRSGGQMAGELAETLRSMNIEPPKEFASFKNAPVTRYDQRAADTFLANLTSVDHVLNTFRGELRGSTGPVQLWPHHFDVAVLWFSGRLVPDADPNDEESADEQMNFGFSCGDDGIPEPYFYATAYPFPDAMRQTPLPHGARWSESWKGSYLLMEELTRTGKGGDEVLEWLRTFHRAGVEWMK